MKRQRDRFQSPALEVIVAVIGGSSADARPANRVYAIVDPTPSRFDLCIAWDGGLRAWSTGQARLGCFVHLSFMLASVSQPSRIHQKRLSIHQLHLSCLVRAGHDGCNGVWKTCFRVRIIGSRCSDRGFPCPKLWALDIRSGTADIRAMVARYPTDGRSTGAGEVNGSVSIGFAESPLHLRSNRRQADRMPDRISLRSRRLDAADAKLDQPPMAEDQQAGVGRDIRPLQLSRAGPAAP